MSTRSTGSFNVARTDSSEPLAVNTRAAILQAICAFQEPAIVVQNQIAGRFISPYDNFLAETNLNRFVDAFRFFHRLNGCMRVESSMFARRNHWNRATHCGTVTFAEAI